MATVFVGNNHVYIRAAEGRSFVDCFTQCPLEKEGQANGVLTPRKTTTVNGIKYYVLAPDKAKRLRVSAKKLEVIPECLKDFHEMQKTKLQQDKNEARRLRVLQQEKSNAQVREHNANLQRLKSDIKLAGQKRNLARLRELKRYYRDQLSNAKLGRQEPEIETLLQETFIDVMDIVMRQADQSLDFTKITRQNLVTTTGSCPEQNNADLMLPSADRKELHLVYLSCLRSVEALVALCFDYKAAYDSRPVAGNEGDDNDVEVIVSSLLNKADPVLKQLFQPCVCEEFKSALQALPKADTGKALTQVRAKVKGVMQDKYGYAFQDAPQITCLKLFFDVFRKVAEGAEFVDIENARGEAVSKIGYYLGGDGVVAVESVLSEISTAKYSKGRVEKDCYFDYCMATVRIVEGFSKRFPLPKDFIESEIGKLLKLADAYDPDVSDRRSGSSGGGGSATASADKLSGAQMPEDNFEQMFNTISVPTAEPTDIPRKATGKKETARRQASLAVLQEGADLGDDELSIRYNALKIGSPRPSKKTSAPSKTTEAEKNEENAVLTDDDLEARLARLVEKDESDLKAPAVPLATAQKQSPERNLPGAENSDAVSITASADDGTKHLVKWLEEASEFKFTSNTVCDDISDGEDADKPLQPAAAELPSAIDEGT